MDVSTFYASTAKTPNYLFSERCHDYKISILKGLRDKVDEGGRSKHIDIKVSKLAKVCVKQFEKDFPKHFPKEECLANGVTELFYNSETKFGTDFFFTNKSLDYIRAFFEKETDKTHTQEEV